jgi:hypothetical protein
MLVERHTIRPSVRVMPRFVNAALHPSGAKPQSGPRKADLVIPEEKTLGAVLESASQTDQPGSPMQPEPPFSLQPERDWPLIQISRHRQGPALRHLAAFKFLVGSDANATLRRGESCPKWPAGANPAR